MLAASEYNVLTAPLFLSYKMMLIIFMGALDRWNSVAFSTPEQNPALVVVSTAAYLQVTHTVETV